MKPHRPKLARDQTLVQRRRHPQGLIEPLLGQIDHPSAQIKIKRKFGFSA